MLRISDIVLSLLLIGGNIGLALFIRHEDALSPKKASACTTSWAVVLCFICMALCIGMDFNAGPTLGAILVSIGCVYLVLRSGYEHSASAQSRDFGDIYEAFSDQSQKLNADMEYIKQNIRNTTDSQRIEEMYDAFRYIETEMSGRGLFSTDGHITKTAKTALNHYCKCAEEIISIKYAIYETSKGKPFKAIVKYGQIASVASYINQEKHKCLTEIYGTDICTLIEIYNKLKTDDKIKLEEIAKQLLSAQENVAQKK